MFKKVIAAVAIIILAVAAFAWCGNDSIKELPATVTAIEQTESAEVVVVDVAMPNNQIHEWAFYANGSYAVGDDVVVEIDLYNDILRDAWHA